MTDVESPSTDTPTSSAKDKTARRKRAFIETGILIVAALVIAFLVKTFLFQAFYIPSESMYPTLKIGDRVLVNKLSYVIRDVHRGDLVVFEAPPEAQSGNIQDFVKRVVGLPGDTIEGHDGQVYVDGRVLEESYLPDGTRTEAFEPTKVPPGHLFMMGDNRSVSRDSRYFGPIEESAVIGHVSLRFWPPGRTLLIVVGLIIAVVVAGSAVVHYWPRRRADAVDDA